MRNIVQWIGRIAVLPMNRVQRKLSSQRESPPANALLIFDWNDIVTNRNLRCIQLQYFVGIPLIFCVIFHEEVIHSE